MVPVVRGKVHGNGECDQESGPPYPKRRGHLRGALPPSHPSLCARGCVRLATKCSALHLSHTELHAIGHGQTPR